MKVRIFIWLSIVFLTLLSVGCNTIRAEIALEQGLEEFNKGNLDEALRYYDQALEFDPGFAMAYNNRSAVFVNKNEFDRAIAEANKAIELDPNLALAYYNRGQAYHGKRSADQALVDLNKSIALDPGYFNAYWARGFAYELKGDLDKAILDYTKMVELDPKSAVAYYNRGQAYYIQALASGNQSVKAKAIADLETFLQLDRNSSDRQSAEYYLSVLKSK